MESPETKKYIKYLFGFALISIVFTLGFFSGRFSLNFLSINTQQLSSPSSESPFESRLLDEVWGKIDQIYIESDFDNDDLVYGAAKGLVDSLGDDYSQFLTPDETNTYNQSSGSKFEGIGAILRYNGEYTIIDTPIDGFPAQRAGLMPGDFILTVDGTDVQGKTSAEVAELIKGPAGTEVLIGIFRPDDQSELEFSIERASIDIDNVEFKGIDNGVAHIKISKFNESNSDEFIRLWDEAVSKSVSADSIILDLRNNPGGLVQLVQYVSEEFLEKRELVMIEEEKDGARREFKSTRDGRLRDKEVVILINEGSASASEILAGALIDNDVAMTVGEKTVGKGVEQRLIELSDGSTMHLVFRRWLTPSGRQVTKDDPIIPDYEVELTTEDFNAGRDPQYDKALELLTE